MFRKLVWSIPIVATVLIVAGSEPAAAQVSVTATAGTLGPTSYSTVRAALAAINAGAHRGDVRVTLTGSTDERGNAAVLNSSGAGAASYSTVVIQPSVDGVTILGNLYGIIQLNGADNVTIDGDNPNTPGTNRNLSIVNDSQYTPFTSTVRIAVSAATTSADNVVIRNLILTGNILVGNDIDITSPGNAANTTFGIYVGGRGGATATSPPSDIGSVTANPAPAGTTVNNLLIQNNEINACGRGIVFNGASTSVSTGVTITNNVIGAGGTATPSVPPFTMPRTTVYVKGIWVAGTSALTITGNTVRNIVSYIGETTCGIELVSQIGASVDVSGNTLSTLANNGAFGGAVKAILVSNAAGYTIGGNIITNVQAVSTAPGTDAIESTANVSSGLVERNRITTVYNRSPNTIGTYGININGGSNVAVRNNFISDLKMNMMNGGSFSTTFSLFGIRIGAGTGHKVLHNSVNLTGSLFGSQNSMLMTAALGIVNPSCTGLDVRNNVLANTLTGGTTRIAHVSLFLPAGAGSGLNLTLDHNAYVCGPDDARQGVGQVGTPSGSAFYVAGYFDPTTTIATNMRSYTSQLSAGGDNDRHSFALVGGAGFVSTTNLHVAAGAQSVLESRGAVGTGVATDFDGDARPGPAGSVNGGAGASDVGADEFDGRPVPHLISDSNPADCGATIRLIATVPTGGTGSIDFREGANVFGTAPLVDGTAVLQTSELAFGPHVLTASYAGDAHYAAGASSPYDQRVITLRTETSLEVVPTTAPCGHVTMTATVTPSSVTGVARFDDGAVALGTVAVANGTATLSVTLPGGNHSLTATYEGGNCVDPSTSPAVNVVSGTATNTTLTSTPNPSVLDEKVTFTSHVTPNDVPGVVRFVEFGGPTLGTVPIVNGEATLSVAIHEVGNLVIDAYYDGDSCHAGSQSPAYIQTVTSSSSTTSLTSKENPSPCGEIVTLRATVTPTTSEGDVTFREGSQVIGTAQVTSGLASVSTFMPIGSHSLTATFNGTSTSAPSTSPPYVQVIEAEAATMADIVAMPSPSVVGQKVTLTGLVEPPDASGDFEFLDGSKSIGYGPVVNGTTEISVVFTTPGRHRLRATYSGDVCHEGSTSEYYFHKVNPAAGVQVAGAEQEAQEGAAAGYGATVTDFTIARITPNPVRSMATIDYALPRAASVRITVVDLQGRAVAELVHGAVSEGWHRAEWNGRRGGSRAPAGLYFVRYDASGRTFVKRFVLQ